MKGCFGILSTQVVAIAWNM